MSTTTHPELLPAVEPLPDVRLSDVARPARNSLGRRLLGWGGGCIGLLWRWFVGAVFCMNYVTSIFVAGWLYRWMQGHVLHNWWKKSARAKEGSFREFCDALIVTGPVPRPRWFWRERIAAVLRQSAPDDRPAGFWRMAWRYVTIPWHSLWLNFKIGVTAIFCTYLLTGVGCLLMWLGWEYGWLNSFNKGYEEAAFGPAVSLTGIALFIAALYYVLMAQVHQAVVGERMAFFDFQFVWKLIQTKPTAYLRLVILLTVVSVPLEMLKAAVFIPPFYGNDANLTDAEVHSYLQQYVFWCCVAFFPLLLWVRRAAANVYSAAVLKALRTGRLSRVELHPKLDIWLSRLDIYPTPAPPRHPVLKVTGAVFGWKYRALIYGLLFLVGFMFVGKRYVGEFLVKHPVAGFMNHELVQIPAFDLITGTPASQAEN